MKLKPLLNSVHEKAKVKVFVNFVKLGNIWIISHEYVWK